MVSRRSVLVCGTAAVVITGACAWGLTRDPKQGRAPWESAEKGFDDPLLDFLAFAVLAPNPHNMQPWRIHRLDETSFDIFPNPERLLPYTDPPSRQITIGFGCFIEMFRLAAANRGWGAEITPFPQGGNGSSLDEENPVATVRIQKNRNVQRDPIFQFALARRTNRAAFALDQPVSDADLAMLADATLLKEHVGYANDASMVETLRSLTLDAWTIEWETAHTRKESIDVTRVGKREINENPWGISLAGALPEGLSGLGILTREKMHDPEASAYKESYNFYAKACETASAYIWLRTPVNDRLHQLEAGRAWVRMHLKATELGLAFHPLSQTLQEFPEMKVPYKRAHELLAPNGGTIQMLVRLGYANNPAPAPRENLEAKLIDL